MELIWSCLYRKQPDAVRPQHCRLYHFHLPHVLTKICRSTTSLAVQRMYEDEGLALFRIFLVQEAGNIGAGTKIVAGGLTHRKPWIMNSFTTISFCLLSSNFRSLFSISESVPHVLIPEFIFAWAARLVLRAIVSNSEHRTGSRTKGELHWISYSSSKP